VSVARAHPSYLASAFPHAGTIFLLASAPARALGEGEMTANVLFRIFTIEIGDTPTLMFEAQNMREAQELCHEQWLKDDLAEAKFHGVPLRDGKAKFRAQTALPDQSALFAEAKNTGQRTDGLMLVYLVELDGEEPPVDPGAFPPART
jgi:hypothetical protein